MLPSHSSRSLIFPAILLFTGAGLCFAQQSPQPPANSPLMQRMSAFLDVPNGAWTPAQIVTMNRLRDAALTDPYAMDELRHLTDNIGPRLSGSPQAQAAVEYVAAEMRSLGAEVTLEKTSVPHWVRGAETGQLVAWPGMAPDTTQKIVLTALGGSVATPADGITAEVIVVNSFNDLKALSPDAVKGKILLFNEKFDKRLAAQGYGFEAYGGAVIYRMSAPVIGAAHGAVAVLVRSVGGADFRLPHTGMTMYDPQGTKIPAAAVTAEDADLLDHLTSQGHVKMKLTLTPQTLPDAESYNVIADWKGTEHPEQVIVISGHLDSWDLGTGAIDDGAGVVVSMQSIHLLSQLGIHPKRTVRFIAWMSEEEGSQGAATYAQGPHRRHSQPHRSHRDRLRRRSSHRNLLRRQARSRSLATPRRADAPTHRRKSALQHPRNRRRHRHHHHQRRPRLRPHSGQPLLLQLPPHPRRHLRQGRRARVERERSSGHGACLRACRFFRACTKVSGVKTTLKPTLRWTRLSSPYM